MTTARPHVDPTQASHRALRRSFILLASVAAVLALLHFTDHAIRGELIEDNQLNPNWNHSGWPFDDNTDKPYVYPIGFLAVFALLLGGIAFTVRGRLWAGYWLATSLVLVVFLVFVHFIGFSTGGAETPSVIALSHHDNVRATLALLILAGLVLVLLALTGQAVRARRTSGHW